METKDMAKRHKERPGEKDMKKLSRRNMKKDTKFRKKCWKDKKKTVEKTEVRKDKDHWRKRSNRECKKKTRLKTWEDYFHKGLQNKDRE